MLTYPRTSWMLVSCLVTVAAAACTRTANPLSPSPVRETGAVVAGVVTGAGDSTPAGLTVGVTGTSLSATVSASGDFEIPDVPAGSVQLQFRNNSVNATAALANVTNDQFIQIRVQLNSTSAVIVNEERRRKVSLCHAEGNGSYHFIDVSEEAEQTHRNHGDGMVGDPVPGQPFRTFDQNCRPVGPEITIEKSTNGADADVAPGPSIPLGSPVTWTYLVTNSGTLDLAGVSVVDDQGVVVDCGGLTTLGPGASMTCTATGVATLTAQYRNVGTVTARFTATAGSGTVTDSDASHYLGISPIELEKSTNGEDADNPPGPSVLAGSAVVWEYVLTNIGAVDLTGIVVLDDQGEAVSCGGATLAPRTSMTCTAAGVAMLGQYSNVGSVTANWAAPAASGTVSGTASASDPSHYRGVSLDELEGPKVDLCHRTGNGSYHLINVSINAEPAHRAHGDGMIGDPVPGFPGSVFGTGCRVD